MKTILNIIRKGEPTERHVIKRHWIVSVERTGVHISRPGQPGDTYEMTPNDKVLITTEP